MLRTVADRLKGMAARAVGRIEKIVDEGINEAVALRAANSILDRIGLKAPERIEARVESAPPMPEGLKRRVEATLRDIEAMEASTTDWSYAHKKPEICTLRKPWEGEDV